MDEFEAFDEEEAAAMSLVQKSASLHHSKGLMLVTSADGASKVPTSSQSRASAHGKAR